MLGNVVLWKPSPMAILSNFLVYQIFREAGLPAGVIQFVPGDPERVCKLSFSSPQFSALHFTGSTKVTWSSPLIYPTIWVLKLGILCAGVQAALEGHCSKRGCIPQLPSYRRRDW
jgi:hypothetical protein